MSSGKGKWIAECNLIGKRIHHHPGQLLGVAVDNAEKADFFKKYWSDKHPHIEVVATVPQRHKEVDFVLIQIRLAGQVQ